MTTQEKCEETICRKIFESVSDDGGQSIVYPELRFAGPEDRVLLGDVEQQVFDFETFFSTIQERRKKRVNRATWGDDDNETVMKAFSGEDALFRAAEDMLAQFTSEEWAIIPSYSDHPAYQVDGAATFVFRYLANGMLLTWPLEQYLFSFV